MNIEVARRTTMRNSMRRGPSATRDTDRRIHLPELFYSALACGVLPRRIWIRFAIARVFNLLDIDRGSAAMKPLLFSLRARQERRIYAFNRENIYSPWCGCVLRLLFASLIAKICTSTTRVLG